MVDYSKRDDIKRWLDAIRPGERRRQVAVVLAARAALRVVPVFGIALNDAAASREQQLLDKILLVFRASAIAWCAAKYPARDEELAYASASGAVGAMEAANAALGSGGAQAAARAALAAASAANAKGKAFTAFAADAARDSVGAAASMDRAHPITRNALQGVVASFTFDALKTESENRTDDTIGSPIWPNGVPGWAAEAWETLKSALLAADKGWDVWTDWYEARLAGDAAHPPNEALEVARAKVPSEIWQRGPAVLNAEIRRLIEEHSEENALDTKFAPILATRAALRVLPLLVNDRDRLGDSAKSKYVLAIFRALAVAWARTEYPSAVEPRLSIAAAEDVKTYKSGSSPIAHYVGGAATESAFASGSANETTAAHRASRALIQTGGAIENSAADVATGVVVEQANSSDVSDIVPGVRPAEIAQVELWPGRDPPQFIGEQWEALKAGLRFADEGWEVWIDWYEARLDGRLRQQNIELAYVEFAHNVSSTASPWEANSEIKRLIDLQPQPSAAPVPATELGPTLEVSEKGLSLSPPAPLGEYDPVVQSALQGRLKRIRPDLLEATRRVGNTHPGLVAVVSEYADLVAQPLENLDVTSLWTVGTGVLANREAFARLPHAGGMTEPLEPAHLALLQQVAEIHGAFILGFARGLELTNRADHSRLTPEILATIFPAARDLLERWRRASTMVEDRTRKFFGAIKDAAMVPSWQTARVGYSVYAVTRNALIGVGKLLLHVNSVAATVIGAPVMTAVDPNLGEQTRLWVQFVLDQSQTILSFSEPFPELKIWLASLIDALEIDKAFRDK